MPLYLVIANYLRHDPLVLEPAVLDQFLGDLHGVQRSALPNVVGDNPHGQAVGVGYVLSDAADEGLVPSDGFGGQRIDVVARIVLNYDTGGPAQDFPGLIGGHRLGQLDVDSLGVADRHRYPHGRGGDQDLRGVHDFAGLVEHLQLFLAVAILHERLDVRKAIEGNLVRIHLRLGLATIQDNSRPVSYT